MVLSDEDIIKQIAGVAKSLDGIPFDVTQRITADTNIVRDLKLDSLAVMDFIMALETRFDTIIPIDGITEIKTIGDLAGLLRPNATQKLP